MIQLILSILSSTLILLIFKYVEKHKMELFPPIVINYLTASVLGFLISDSNPVQVIKGDYPWLWFSLLIGILLIVNFYLIGTSTQKAGIAVTTVAAKMSFVLPMLFSLMYDPNDAFTPAKIMQLFAAALAVYLVIYPNKGEQKAKNQMLLPVLIFVGLGVLDTLIKYCQTRFITNDALSGEFSAFNFTVAAVVGLILLLFNKKYLSAFTQPRVWLTGIALGTANFGSMYFLINALNALKYNNSLVFGINNIGIVVLGVLIALFFFKERFNKVNWIGLILALLVLIAMVRIFV